MKSEVLEFLQQSNYLESESRPIAFDDAVLAWKYLNEKKNLTVNRILETHRILLANIDKENAGKIRECSVWVGRRVCPKPYTLPALLEGWIKVHGQASSDEQIKQAHIAFEEIHPFVDGNGRVGRIIMNWQREKNNLPILIIHEGFEQREYYKWFN